MGKFWRATLFKSDLCDKLIINLCSPFVLLLSMFMNIVSMLIIGY